MERYSGFSYDLGFALCLKGDLDMAFHRSLDWTVTLQNSGYRSTIPLEQGKIVKIKVLNTIFSPNICVGTEKIDTSNFICSWITGRLLQLLYCFYDFLKEIIIFFFVNFENHLE